jgi:hypothetical protein
VLARSAMCAPVGRRLVAQPPNSSRRCSAHRHRHIPPCLRLLLDDTCKTTRARVSPAIPVQTLVLTTGPPAVRPSLRSTTTSKCCSIFCLPTTGRSTLASTQPRTTTPTPTRLLEASLARQPSLRPPYSPPSNASGAGAESLYFGFTAGT